MMRTHVFVALAIVLTGASAFAQSPPHPVYFNPVRCAEGGWPSPGEFEFRAYIETRPNEILTEDSPGCGVWEGANGLTIMVECSAFPSGWSQGDNLLVHAFGICSNGVAQGLFSCVLSYGSSFCPPPWPADAWLLGTAHPVVLTPITYSDGITPILVDDLDFEAWISTNPLETISNTDLGNSVFDHPDGYGVGILVQCGLFPSGWALGDTLAVNVTGAGSNWSGPESCQIRCVLSDHLLGWVRRWSTEP